MIYDLEKRFVFIHIPRTAGVAISLMPRGPTRLWD